MIGRSWILKQVKSELSRNSSRGLLLVAKRLYGKTALTCHIACARFVDEAHEIRRSLLLYHICDFTSKSTSDPTLFIQDLIGMMCKRVNGFCLSLRQDTDSMKYTDPNICENNINDCLSKAVISVLRKVDPKQKAS